MDRREELSSNKETNGRVLTDGTVHSAHVPVSGATELSGEVRSTAPQSMASSVVPARLDKIMAHQDHVVVSDLTSEKGFKSVSLTLLVSIPDGYKLFIGSAKECEAWVMAPNAEARQGVERRAEKRVRQRIQLPSEGNGVEANRAGLNAVVDKFKLKIRDVQTALFGDEPNKSNDRQIKL